MIDFFGIKISLFVKYLIFLSFIFFAFRIVRFFAKNRGTNDKDKKTILTLFTLTEIFSWLFLIIWTLKFVKHQIWFLAISVFYVFLNFLGWLFVKKYLGK